METSTASELRLHSGENPYGPSPAVLRALDAELGRLHRYPDGSCEALKAAIALHHGVPADRVLVGNGVDEVILLLVLALADREREAVVTDGTFRSYAESLLAARQPFTACAMEGYRQPVKELARRLRAGAVLGFVCQPHNPTGGVLVQRELRELREATAEGGGVLVVDEAYAEYAGDDFCSALPMAATGSGVCVLRTFSKAYALAGLRVGYAVGDDAVISAASRARGALPYNVNRFAQSAAMAALADQEHMRRAARAVVETREWFRARLCALGLTCPPSRGNFVLIDAAGREQAVAAALNVMGCRVRDTGDMGLPGHVRISIGTPAEMEAVLDRLTGVLATSSDELDGSLA
ncbi:histidinol-phosphate transaminase [Nonomuraea angiospora]|uniref:pyridoxal phosphate-dependent aminotransferase n=1 Tax=Nonomuraea angiospora TaxID=46172 RepID=UPI0033CBD89C